jgi:hypothetical protein
MAAAAWRLYAKAKEYIGDGTIQLGTQGLKMALFRGSSNAFQPLRFQRLVNYQRGKLVAVRTLPVVNIWRLLPVLGRLPVQRLRLTTPRWALPLRPRVLTLMRFSMR